MNTPPPDISPTQFPAHRLGTGLLLKPLEPLERNAVVAEAIEQVMRVSDDEDLVLHLLCAEPGTPAAAAAAGRLMSAPPVQRSLAPGCPVLAFATRSSLNIGWRRWCRPTPGSMFYELQLYRDLLTGDPCTPAEEHIDAYAELEAARSTLMAAAS